MAGSAGVFPGRDELSLGRVLEGFRDDASLHVAADGEAESVEDGRGEVQETCVQDGLGGVFDAGAFGEEDALVTMPDRVASMDPGSKFWAKVI